MPDGNIPRELTQGLLAEYLGYQTHIGTEVELLAIGCGNTGTLLTTVLESEQSEEGKSSYILIWGIDTKNAASLVQTSPAF
jgi:hypothetical protein